MVSHETRTEAPVMRQQIFVLVDGIFVVQWSDTYVQELLTGKYRSYQFIPDFGCPIGDFELRQLQVAGCVKDFDRHTVWLYALPQWHQSATKSSASVERMRAYYINTALSAVMLDEVRQTLYEHGLDHELWARERGGFVVLMAKGGTGIPSVEEAEQSLFRLRILPTSLFDLAIVGFIETKAPYMNYLTARDKVDRYTLDVFADFDKQRELSVAEDKIAVMAIPQKDEQQAIRELLESMDLTVHLAGTGRDTIFLLEDYQPDLLILDMNLTDMHAWKLLLELKERVDISEVPILVIANEHKVMPLDNITTVVRPVGLAQLRYTIWSLLAKDGNEAENENPST